MPRGIKNMIEFLSDFIQHLCCLPKSVSRDKINRGVNAVEGSYDSARHSLAHKAENTSISLVCVDIVLV